MSEPIEYVITCKCQGTNELAMSAFLKVFPDRRLPEMLIGRNAILDAADRNPGTKTETALRGISKNKERYAYYLKEEDGNIELWDLMKGVRIP